MPWFRLEESFHSNPKVVAAGNCAVGLWVRCATWSAQYLTDGVIPADVVRTFGGTKRDIDTLTATRLWVPIDGSYVLRDWTEYQPSALEVKESRRRDADRKREGRAKGGGQAVRRGTVGRDTTGRFAGTDEP